LKDSVPRPPKAVFLCLQEHERRVLVFHLTAQQGAQRIWMEQEMVVLASVPLSFLLPESNIIFFACWKFW
jgi:hypothetical protein